MKMCAAKWHFGLVTLAFMGCAATRTPANNSQALPDCYQSSDLRDIPYPEYLSLTEKGQTRNAIRRGNLIFFTLEQEILSHDAPGTSIHVVDSVFCRTTAP